MKYVPSGSAEKLKIFLEKIKIFLEDEGTVTVNYNGGKYDILLIKTISCSIIMCKQVGYSEKYNNDKAYSQICDIIMIILERSKII